MTQSTSGKEKTYLSLLSKDLDQTPQSLPSRNHGIGTTLFTESRWDSRDTEKDPYLYNQEMGNKKHLNFGEKMQFVILQNAINELYSKEPEIKKEAESWFASPESKYIFSFECICLTFNLNPVAVRKALVDKRWDWNVLRFRTNGRR